MPELDVTQASLIALMIVFPDEAVDKISDLVPEEWFTGDYRTAYRYIVDNDHVDIPALSAGTGIDDNNICAWINQEFSIASLQHHVKNLEKEASMRRVRNLAQKLRAVDTPEEAIDLVEKFGTSISVRDKTEPVGIKKALAGLSKELERRYEARGELLGMSYGLRDLDEKTEGMHKGDLVIVAGPSSMGKTAMAIGFAEAAAQAGNKVMIFSCEMTNEQLLMRSLSSHSNIPLGKIRSARFTDADWARMARSFEEMHSWPIILDDPAGIGLSELARKVRKAKKQGLDLVVIDYLQIMKYDKSKENQELDIITTALKNLAKELGICIVLLSQLNRGSEKEKRKPNLTDLRGSGMIENNADVVLFPYREGATCQLCREKVNNADHDLSTHQSVAEVIIGKQRQGERNISVPLMWIGEKTRFVNLAKGFRDV